MSALGKIWITVFGDRAVEGRDWNEVWRSRTDFVFQQRHKDVCYLVSENSAVIDIGCGDGALLHFLKKNKGCHVLGIDGSAVACALARGKDVPCIESFGQIFAPNYPWDYAVLCESLEHMVNPEAMLLGAVSIADSVIFSVPNSGFILYRLRLLFGRVPQQNPDHVRFWTYRDMKKWLNQLGLWDRVEILRGGRYRMGPRILSAVWPNMFAQRILCKIGDEGKQTSEFVILLWIIGYGLGAFIIMLLACWAAGLRLS